MQLKRSLCEQRINVLVVANSNGDVSCGLIVTQSPALEQHQQQLQLGLHLDS